MEDDPVKLDTHRGMAAQKATDLRRQLHEVAADQAALKQRQVELETFLQSAPAATRAEAAERACYLLRLFAATPEAQDPRRQKLIDSVIEDLKRLTP
ncbi:MAG: hypothetical protein HY060_11040 [Proteobacteria bacterium]|nr:hypothetical protein [Pseudomonadota bacterium]